jgi:hypothetical protein
LKKAVAYKLEEQPLFDLVASRCEVQDLDVISQEVLTEKKVADFSDP